MSVHCDWNSVLRDTWRDTWYDNEVDTIKCLKFLSLSVFLSVVKPDPPVDVRVSPHNDRNLLVEWAPPPSWTNLEILPLKYQILYQWENRGNPKSVNVRIIFTGDSTTSKAKWFKKFTFYTYKNTHCGSLKFPKLFKHPQKSLNMWNSFFIQRNYISEWPYFWKCLSF